MSFNLILTVIIFINSCEMTIKSYKILALMSFFISVIIGCLYFYKADRVVGVHSQEIFEGFNMTREMKSFGEREVSKRQKVIDSLYSFMNSTKKSAESEKLLREVSDLERSLAQFSDAFVKDESGKIWKRINIYAKEFSEKKDYDFLLMANSGGNLLYMRPDKDVTIEFLQYINSKYEGNK